MPRGLRRFQKAESLHFITFSCFHRLPLVEKPEDWPRSSFRHYAIGAKQTVEIESHWTALRRGNQLPQGVRIELGKPSQFLTLSGNSVETMALHRPQQSTK
jgi:hypothetical protein